MPAAGGFRPPKTGGSSGAGDDAFGSGGSSTTGGDDSLQTGCWNGICREPDEPGLSSNNHQDKDKDKDKDKDDSAEFEFGGDDDGDDDGDDAKTTSIRPIQTSGPNPIQYDHNKPVTQSVQNGNSGKEFPVWAIILCVLAVIMVLVFCLSLLIFCIRGKNQKHIGPSYRSEDL
jgi:hypothetical protein